jgi:hypothetical protein
LHGHLPGNFRNNFDKIHQPPQSRITRQRLSQTLPSALKWRDHARWTFPHNLGRKRSFRRLDPGALVIESSPKRAQRMRR